MFYKKEREVVCTICSSKKDPRSGLMPARRRYLGEHVHLAGSAAGFRPLYILSGQFGLISAKMAIPNYDHILVQGEVDTLAERVSRQIKNERIKVLFYYQYPDPGWQPYTAVLSKAASVCRVELVHMLLPTRQEILQALPQVADAPALA